MLSASSPPGSSSSSNGSIISSLLWLLFSEQNTTPHHHQQNLKILKSSSSNRNNPPFLHHPMMRRLRYHSCNIPADNNYNSPSTSTSSSSSSCDTLGSSGGGESKLSPQNRRRIRVRGKKKEGVLQVLLCYVIVTVLSLLVYWNSLDGDFVHDDVVSIVRNPDVRPHSSWIQMWLNDYWGMPMASQMSHKSYRPLTVLTFRINFWLAGGLSPVSFHVTNVLIHIVVSLLLFTLGKEVLRMSLFSALTASLLFAVHPVHTEAVAGITGRSDALACLLMLSSFLLYSKSITQNTGGGGLFSHFNLNRGIVLSAGCGCVAMLAKETGITVMGINVLYDLWLHTDLVKRWLMGPNNNKHPHHLEEEDKTNSRLRRRVTFMTALTSVTLAWRIALMNGSFPRFSPQDNPAAYAKDDLTRFMTYMFLPVFNAWLILCPSRLSYDWQMGSIPLVESAWDIRNLYSLIFYGGFLALLASSLSIFIKGRGKDGGAYEEEETCLRRTKKKIVFVSLLFISFPFLPASNLLFPVGFVAAERILYTPSVGICLLTATGIERVLQKRRILTVLCLCLMLMSFSIKTWDRNFVWKSRGSLFESGVRENPWNAKVHYNYANLQKDLGDIESAVKHYKIAIRLWPSYASAYNNLGALSEDLEVAEDSFLRAIDANPQHNGAHFNLGVIYMRSEKYLEALEHLEECLKIDPSHVEALQYLGACYNVLNKTHEAENVFHKLISSDLPPSKLHTNFGVFLEQLGLTSKALTHFLLALTKTSWDMQALVHAAKLAYQLGSEQLFHQLSERLLNMKFDPSIGYMLVSSYMEQGKLLDAQLLFQKLFSESEGESESTTFYKIQYAQLLMKFRRFPDAAWVIEGILRDQQGNDPVSILLLSQIYERMNKTMEAVDLLNCAIDKFCPQEGDLCAQFYSQLGNLMHTNGAFLSAANYYDMAIKFNPKSVQAHTNIGAIYHLMSNYKQAESHYLAALAIEPRNQVVLSNMRKLEKAQNSVTLSSVIHTPPPTTTNRQHHHLHINDSFINKNNGGGNRKLEGGNRGKFQQQGNSREQGGGQRTNKPQEGQRYYSRDPKNDAKFHFSWR